MRDRLAEREAADQRAFHQSADQGRFHNRLHNPHVRRKEQALAAAVAQAAGGGVRNLLEVGCGEGSNLYFLAQALPRAAQVGLDFSPGKLGFLRRRLPGTAVVCGDATCLPLAGASFDLVLLRDLLHHVNFARRQALAEAFRLLRPGGALVVLESHGGKLLNRVFMALLPVERGLKDSRPESLLALGRELGRAQLSFVEASFALRALGYVLGWPTGWLSWPARAVYALAALWEGLVKRLLKPSRWTYMMLVIPKPGERALPAGSSQRDQA